jgi:Holliday junction DNA helicase RuvA
MIASLNGKLLTKSTTNAVVECGGVGYFVNISISTFEKLPERGETIFLFTVYQLREDAVTLFGFVSEADREAFLILNSVSGIGGKTALAILSSITVSELVKFITNQNLPALQKLPGIGKKTAERLCFELKDKIMTLNTADSGLTIIQSNNQSVNNEAISALISLGYNKVIAEKAVKAAQKTLDDDVKVESLIKVALKYTMN